MNKRNNGLMIAYMVLVLIAIAYKMYCDIYRKSFENWNNIIVAITVSSYFFSIASLIKAGCDLSYNRQTQMLDFDNQVKAYRDKLSREQPLEKSYVEDLVDLKKAIDVAVNSELKRYSILNILYYAFIIIGFVSFFVFTIIFKTPISENTQGYLVVWAFFLMIFTSFIYDVIKNRDDKMFDKFDKAFDALVFSHNTRMKCRERLESEEDNGQVKNENE